jgi:hypothetical protein
MTELTQTPNAFAAVPTGMCGSPKKCAACPSDFLCYMKAKGENDIIASRESNAELDCDGDHPDAPDNHHEGCWFWFDSLPPVDDAYG